MHGAICDADRPSNARVTMICSPQCALVSSAHGDATGCLASGGGAWRIAHEWLQLSQYCTMLNGTA